MWFRKATATTLASTSLVYNSVGDTDASFLYLATENAGHMKLFKVGVDDGSFAQYTTMLYHTGTNSQGDHTPTQVLVVKDATQPLISEIYITVETKVTSYKHDGCEKTFCSFLLKYNQQLNLLWSLVINAQHTLVFHNSAGIDFLGLVMIDENGFP